MCPPRSFFLFLAFYPRRRCPLPSAFLISSFPLSLSLRRINIPPPCDAPLPSLISIYEQTYASFSQLVCAILMETPLPFLTSNVSFEEFSNGEKSYHSRRNHHYIVVTLLFICLQKPVGKQYGTLERSPVVFARAHRMGDKKRHRAHRFGPRLRGRSRLAKTRGKLS